MKIVLLVISIIVAYFLLKRNKQSREIIKDTNDMVICGECGFHVLEKNLCHTQSQINQCPNKK